MEQELNINSSKYRKRNPGLPKEAKKIPFGVLKNIAERMTSQASKPWQLIAESLPRGVKAETAVNASALSITYTFIHEQMGELGRIDARFTGDQLSLSQLLCGVCKTDGSFQVRDAGKFMMLDIYEKAKEAFGAAD